MLNYHPGNASQVDTVVEVLTGFNRKTPAIQENERYVHVFWNGSKSKPWLLDLHLLVENHRISPRMAVRHMGLRRVFFSHTQCMNICVPSPGFNHLPDSSWFHIFKKTSQLSPSQISMFFPPFHPIPDPWHVFYEKKRIFFLFIRKRIRNFIILTLSHSKNFQVFLNSKALSLYTLWHFVSRSIPSTLSFSNLRRLQSFARPQSPSPSDPFGQGTGKAGPFRVPLRVQKVVLAKPQQLLDLLGIRPRAQTLQGL